MKRLLLLAGVAAIAAGATIGGLLATRSSDSGSPSNGARAAIGPPPGPYRGSEPPPGILAPDFALRSYHGSRDPAIADVEKLVDDVQPILTELQAEVNVLTGEDLSEARDICLAAIIHETTTREAAGCGAGGGEGPETTRWATA